MCVLDLPVLPLNAFATLRSASCLSSLRASAWTLFSLLPSHDPLPGQMKPCSASFSGFIAFVNTLQGDPGPDL